jgi:hypothetical protein
VCLFFTQASFHSSKFKKMYFIGKIRSQSVAVKPGAIRFLRSNKIEICIRCVFPAHFQAGCKRTKLNRQPHTLIVAVLVVSCLALSLLLLLLLFGQLTQQPFGLVEVAPAVRLHLDAVALHFCGPCSVPDRHRLLRRGE